MEGFEVPFHFNPSLGPLPIWSRSQTRPPPLVSPSWDKDLFGPQHTRTNASFVHQPLSLSSNESLELSIHFISPYLTSTITTTLILSYKLILWTSILKILHNKFYNFLNYLYGRNKFLSRSRIRIFVTQ